MDGFVAVHFFGWWIKVLCSNLICHFINFGKELNMILKTLIVRDWWLCMVTSILFEVVEYTLEHQLPNFSECWWDHVSVLKVIVYGMSKSFVITDCNIPVGDGCFGM